MSRCCFWVATDQPRMLFDRHDSGCLGDDCRGCLPCPRPLCLGCYRAHDEHVCPLCLADVRETLSEIGRLCDALPAEAERKGVDSEAMNLLLPAADPEAIGHMRASIAVGRIPEDWLETADHELHPLQVCGTWMEAYLEAFEHDEPARITVTSALSYLTRNLEHIGTEDDIPFRDLRRDLSACRTHLERVLHDGEQVETGAPCMGCSTKGATVRLRRVRSDGHREDQWTCPKCTEQSNDSQYRFAVRNAFIEESPELNADDMAVRTGLASSTIRKWAHVMRTQAKGEEAIEWEPLIKPVGVVNGRKVYRVVDVEKVNEAGGDWRQTRARKEAAARRVAQPA